MSTSWWRVRSKLKTYGAALVLAMLGALLALVISVFINSFSTLDSDQYEPKDIERGRKIEREK